MRLNFFRLRIWPNTLASTLVGQSYSHCRLDSSQQQHQFCENWQTLTTKHYRFPFITSSLAEFTDCSLLRLQLLVFSHIVPCECYTPPYFMWISCFSLCGHTHFCLFFNQFTLNINMHYIWFILFKSMFILFALKWTTGCTFDHFYLLSRTQSPPFCPTCYHQTS